MLLAGFFFHERGLVENAKTLEGLIKTILHQVFSHYQSLIPEILPQAWKEALGERLVGIGRFEIMQAFKYLINQSSLDLHLFLFIDGLDEFKGEPGELVRLLQTLTSGGPGSKTRVQLCVSSREWPIYEHTYGSGPHLRMQDVTRSDMEAYSRTKLLSIPRFHHLFGESFSSANTFITDLVSKSRGVFLWIFLVVRDLVEGLLNFDSIDDLFRILASLPDELDSLYKSIIDRIPERYRQEAARYFNLLQVQERGDLTPLMLGFAEQHIECLLSGEFARRIAPDRRSYEQEVLGRTRSRCLGLVDWTFPRTTEGVEYFYGSGFSENAEEEPRAEFIHLTFLELLRNGAQETWIQDYLQTDVSPHERLAAMYVGLTHLSLVLEMLPLLPFPALEVCVTHYLNHICHAEGSQDTNPISILASLMAMEQAQSMLHNDPDHHQHWTARRWIHGVDPPSSHSNLTSLMVAENLIRTLRCYMEVDGAALQKSGLPLLLYACQSYHITALLTDFEWIEPKMVSLLLGYGCDANERWQSQPDSQGEWWASTPWEVFLSRAYFFFSRKTWRPLKSAAWYQDKTHKLLQVVDLFLDNGADPNVLVQVYGGVGSTHSVLRVIEHVCSDFDDPLRDIIIQKLQELSHNTPHLAVPVYTARTLRSVTPTPIPGALDTDPSPPAREPVTHILSAESSATRFQTPPEPTRHPPTNPLRQYHSAGESQYESNQSHRKRSRIKSFFAKLSK